MGCLATRPKSPVFGPPFSATDPPLHILAGRHRHDERARVTFVEFMFPPVQGTRANGRTSQTRVDEEPTICGGGR